MERDARIEATSRAVRGDGGGTQNRSSPLALVEGAELAISQAGCALCRVVLKKSGADS